jgi:hypothetical protein
MEVSDMLVLLVAVVAGLLMLRRIQQLEDEVDELAADSSTQHREPYHPPGGVIIEEIEEPMEMIPVELAWGNQHALRPAMPFIGHKLEIAGMPNYRDAWRGGRWPHGGRRHY